MKAFHLVGPGALANTDRYFVVAIDPLGNGVSALPDGPITIGDMVSTQFRVLTEVLDLDHLFAVIGISMGAMQAIEWTLRYPDFVERAIPIAGTPRMTSHDREAHAPIVDLVEAFEDPERRQRELFRLILRRHADIVRALRRGGRRQWRQGLLPNIYRFRGTEWRRQWEAISRYDAVAGREDLANAAATVRARVLSVGCERDQYVEPGPLRALTERIPRARHMELVGDAGHLNFYTERVALTNAVHAFLRE